MTAGTKSSYGPALGIYPRWSRTKTWSGADKNSTGGKLLPHAYAMTGVSQYNGELIYVPNGNRYTVTEILGLGAAAPEPTWTASDELKLLSKLADLIRGHDFNAGIFLGTGAQTAQLIGSAAYRIAQGLRSLKRGDGVGDIINALKTDRGGRISPRQTVKDTRVDLSQKWLEASYGWSPLLQDVYSAGEALAKHVEGVQKFEFTATVGKSSHLENIDAISATQSSCEKSVKLCYSAASIHELPSQWDNLGLTNPGSIIWELTPWSFVIDWFLPVGSFIDLQTIIPRLTGSWWRTERVKVVHIRRPRNAAYIGITPIILRSTKITRSVGSGNISVPLPSFKSPWSKDWRRMANALALLGSMR